MKNVTAPQHSACLCGCKNHTRTATANYLPGHDASHVSNLLAYIAQSGDLSSGHTITLGAALPSEALKVKFYNAVNRLVERRAPKKSRKDGVWLDVDHTSAKLGRWTYPVQELVHPTNMGDEPTGKFQRNTKRDGSGEWVALGDALLISQDD